MLCQTAILMPFFLCTIVLDMIDVNILIYIITRCYITMTIYFTEIKEYDCYILFFCSQTTSSEVCTGEKFDGGVRRRFGAWLYHPRVPLPWGDTSDTSEGSEHTVNSIRYPMEVVTKIKHLQHFPQTPSLFIFHAIKLVFCPDAHCKQEKGFNPGWGTTGTGWLGNVGSLYWGKTWGS